VTADKTDGSARKRAVGSVAEVMLVKRRSYACKESAKAYRETYDAINGTYECIQRDLPMHAKRRGGKYV
jgi:hypothetical protein